MSEKPLKDLSILLVEDNEMNTLLASAIIERTGATITEADNGMDAINILKKRSFDIVLMDLHMPVMNGFETTKHIRENLALNIPIIAITANVVNDEEKKCLDAGMNGFISKPYTEKSLLDKISETLSNAGKSQVIASGKFQKMETPLYDLSMLTDITKGNTVLLQRMLRVFSEQAPATAKELQQAYAGGNLPKAASLAHSIKPNIDSMGISTLKDTIRKVESLATNGAAGQELEDHITTLVATIDNVVQQLKHELS